MDGAEAESSSSLGRRKAAEESLGTATPSARQYGMLLARIDLARPPRSAWLDLHRIICTVPEEGGRPWPETGRCREPSPAYLYARTVVSHTEQQRQQLAS
ncbi:hypothetical protein C2845_PM04G33670 [Panicum miliaceum]|uniref:Uncharacterized protein n=1 Tax=Panicum miliaceum TaxID=4540 RepID=A0A3L6QNN9_PANMI|nr:hypothetical protein C2845_PM04G33670 [Panicum miliaceum]